jgi:hypothetical protein
MCVEDKFGPQIAYELERRSAESYAGVSIP